MLCYSIFPIHCPLSPPHHRLVGSPSFEKMGDREVNVRTYTAAFNLKGAAQEKLVGNMSGGERNRVHLAKVCKGRDVKGGVGIFFPLVELVLI